MRSVPCSSSSTFIPSRRSKALKSTLLCPVTFDVKLPLITSVERKGKIEAVGCRRRERDPKKRVVVTGMGVVSVFGNDVDAYYSKLLEGESGITAMERFDASEFPVRIAGEIRGFGSEGLVDGKIERRLDDCWRYCFVAAKKALQHAGLTTHLLNTMEKKRMGVLVGSAMGGVTTFSNGVKTLFQKGYKSVSPFCIPFIPANTGSALLALDTGFTGPNYSISTACASANHCLIAAANHIRRGDANLMVAGGAEAAIAPITLASFIACGALSRRNRQPHMASRPWDRHRDGFVVGEGAGVLIMESLEHAMERGSEIYAEFLGGAANFDAHHITSPHPDGVGIMSCIIKSLQDAGVAPEEVNYVNAHATSTPAGDLAELNALNKVFTKTSEMKMNATKSMIGHALGAAGALEAIATIKAINTGWLHPTVNQYDLEPKLSIDTVPNVKKQHEVNVAISNSFGFGGHNSVVVLAPFRP